MKKIVGRFCVLISLIALFSCVDKCKEVAGEINGKKITLTNVDKLITQELYEELYRIYLIRKKSFDKNVEDEILKSAAKDKNCSVPDFTSGLYRMRLKQFSLKQFAEKEDLLNGFKLVVNNRIRQIPLNTREGELMLIEKYRDYVVESYIDSVKKKADIKCFILPPKNPSLRLDHLKVHYKGAKVSPITIIFVSDFECDICRKEYHHIEHIYKKYKDKVRFGFINYSPFPTMSYLGCLAAERQNKFWPFYNSVFSMKEVPNQNELLSVAKANNLDLTRFKNDMESGDIYSKVMENMKLLNKSGIYGTPTIIFNNRILSFNDSVYNVEFLIENEFHK